MKIIGLLGGIASGKSMVAGQLADCGAKVLDADQIGHEVLQQPEIEAALRERWGSEILARTAGSTGDVWRGLFLPRRLTDRRHERIWSS